MEPSRSVQRNFLATADFFAYVARMDLKDAARRAGLTGADIARRFRVGKATSSRWLTRRTPVPPRHVKKFAALLKIEPGDVLPGDAVVKAMGARG